MPDPVFDALSRLPVIGFDAGVEHRRLGALHEEAQALLSGAPGVATATNPAVSGWSPAQHVAHWAAISGSVLEWVRGQCAEGDKADPRGGPNVNGYVVLLTGYIPRGRAKTPSLFAPPEQPDPEGVAATLAKSREELRALTPHLARLRTLGGRRDHPRMGRLNPREWVRFACVHTRHHQRIVRDVVEAGA